MITRLLCAAAFGLTLAACGGGGGGGDNSPPPSAPSNNAPVAVAGEDFTQALASSGTQLDGSGSSDADGDTLSYSWSITSQPAGASASFDNASAAQPRLQTLVPGVYQIELRVSDGRGGSSTDTVEADLTNDDPVLNLAPIQSSIAVGIPLALDATGSSDPNGQPLSYTWTVTGKPVSSNLLQSFTGPSPLIELDAEGNFSFSLAVSDGYATVSRAFTISASTYYRAVVEDGFDRIAMAATPRLIEPSTQQSPKARLNTPTDAIAVTSEATTVRIVSVDGSTQRSFEVPTAIEDLSVSTNGGWIGVAHANAVSIIDLASNEVATWATSAAPRESFIGIDGYMYWTSQSEGSARIIATNPTSGEETPTDIVWPNTRFKALSDSPLVYALATDFTPGLLQRYEIFEPTIVSLRWDEFAANDGDYCGNFWISADNNQILTACGIIVTRTDDPATDLQFFGELASYGTIVDAAYQSSTQRWLVIEERNGIKEANVYDGETGSWLRTLDLPEVSAGEATVPLSINVNQSTQIVTIFASDHPTNPINFALLRLAEVDARVVDQPPVTIVPRYASGRVQEPVLLDAGQSYDREGQSVGFNWSLISEPDGSALTLSSTSGSSLEFTPAIPGDYVFSLITSDGNRQSEARTIDVRVFELGDVFQIRLNGTPTDVTYNKVRNQILYTSAEAERLTILDLNSMQERVVELDLPGNAVGVSPDGSHAAVSHVGLSSLINLSGSSRNAIDTQALSTDWGDIVIDDRQIAYTIPETDQIVNFQAIDFANNTIFEGGARSAKAVLRMLPAGGAVYQMDRNSFPSGISRFDVSDLSAITNSDSEDVYEENVRVNGNIWISETSDQLLTAGGSVLRLSDVLEQDLTFIENMFHEVNATWADHSQEQQRWAVAINNSIRFFSDTSYAQMDEQEVDGLYIDAPGTIPNINRAFYSDDGNRLIVVANSPDIADSGYVVQIIE